MKKKQIAYILMALGAVAAIIYYFSTKSTDGAIAEQDSDIHTISDDAGTYNQLMGLVPVSNREAVAKLAKQRYNSGNVAPWVPADGSITQTGALMSAYLHYYGVSAAETQNRITAFQIWDAFKARH